MPNTPQIFLLLFTLYWAQGLPVGFMTHALPVILRSEGVSLTHIGGFGLLMLPWGIKVLWAPLVDRFGISRIGHYRSWILPTQLITIILLIFLSFLPISALNQPQYLLGFFIVLFLINSTGATQDIATDGLAVKILKGEQQHWGNMFQVVGSRLGFIVGGGAILWALDLLSWQNTFLILALLVALNSVMIWFYTEEPAQIQKQRPTQPLNRHELWLVLGDYFQYFQQNRQMMWWMVVLCTIKIADGLTGPITKPLLVDLKLSYSQIGVYITMLGAGAALLGAGLASVILSRFSRGNTLIVFSILKVLSLAGFLWLAIQLEQGHQVQAWLIYLINAFEDLFAAMLLVVILTLVMQYSRQQHAATDFTFQVSVMGMVSGGLYIVSGKLGDVLGYATYLMWICSIAVLMLLPVVLWRMAQIRQS